MNSTAQAARIVTPTPEHIARAAALLRAGKLVALPTETVYGLGADALNPAAVTGIFHAKGRPADHPLIVHLPSSGHLPRWARRIPEEALALASAFWPGPLTLILPRQDGVPGVVTGGQDTVGLRVPAHPAALALLSAFGSGIAAPSANRFGRISPTTASHVEQELGGRVELILDGGSCQVGIESTILDLSRDEPEILRPGAITTEDIGHVIGHRPRVRGETPEHPGGQATAPRVSGALAAHYAPSTPLRLLPGAELAAAAVHLAAQKCRIAVLAHTCPHPVDDRLQWIMASADPARYAHDLYAHLRALDALGADCLLVEAPSADPAWSAITDRLRRAAAGSGESGET